ncbi:MAG: hypothetical protein R6U31_01080 [bacterium]
MRKTIFILCILFYISLASSTGYTIFFKGRPAGYYYIEHKKGEVFEKALWIDGFSRHYSAGKHNFNDDYSYISTMYFRDNALPEKMQYFSGRFEKRGSNYSLNMPVSEKDIIILNPQLPLYALLQAVNSSSSVFFVPDERIVPVSGSSIAGIEYSIFGNSHSPDSIIWGNYTFRRGQPVNFSNPYSIDYSSLITKEDFRQKPLSKKIRIGSINGELYFNRKEYDKLVIVLPFNYFSDRYSNTVSTRPFTGYQIAQSIDCPVYIFDFAGDKPDSRSIIANIRAMYNYFSRHFSDIVFIGFNAYASVYLLTGIEAPLIAVNPPLIDYHSYTDLMFALYNAENDFIYSSAGIYRRYDPFYPLLKDRDMLNMYSREDILILYSADVLSQRELEALSSSKCPRISIRNVDRRLNSYKMKLSDLRNYKEVPHIHSEIKRYLNKLIEKY